MQLHVAAERRKREDAPHAEVRGEEERERLREIRRVARGRRVHHDETERRRQHHGRRHDLPRRQHDQRRLPEGAPALVERVVMELSGVPAQLRPHAQGPGAGDACREHDDRRRDPGPLRCDFHVYASKWKSPWIALRSLNDHTMPCSGMFTTCSVAFDTYAGAFAIVLKMLSRSVVAEPYALL